MCQIGLGLRVGMLAKLHNCLKYLSGTMLSKSKTERKYKKLREAGFNKCAIKIEQRESDH